MRALRRRLSERRKNPRYVVSGDAKILFRNRCCLMKCTIIEISNTGARIKPEDAWILPNEFALKISPEQEVLCEAIHRSEFEIGVRFISR